MTEKDLEIQMLRRKVTELAERNVRLLAKNLELVKMLDTITKDITWLVEDLTKAKELL